MGNPGSRPLGRSVAVSIGLKLASCDQLDGWLARAGRLANLRRKKEGKVVLDGGGLMSSISVGVHEDSYIGVWIGVHCGSFSG